MQRSTSERSILLRGTTLARFTCLRRTPGFYGIAHDDSLAILCAVVGNVEVRQRGHVYSLRELFVDPDPQRSGVGTKILKELQERLVPVDYADIRGLGTTVFVSVRAPILTLCTRVLAAS